MLSRLRLNQFKNFQDAELLLGPLTVLVGGKCDWKSNIRDAFRFVHGIARGYSLAEIIGEKWIEGGVLQWKGIRGGTREAAFAGSRCFSLEVTLKQTRPDSFAGIYRIEVDVGEDGQPPRIRGESLRFEQTESYSFQSSNDQDDPRFLKARVWSGERGRPKEHVFTKTKPVISQLEEMPGLRSSGAAHNARDVLRELGSMRFLDLSADAMRLPSIPGQVILGDRGENLSSVLQAICGDLERKNALIEWIRELTPMDARDFAFPTDQAGRVLLVLVEEGGRRTSAYSASDGTLRFLAMLAALLGPEPARFYFIEELDTGIHPTRLHLLMNLIEQRVFSGETQIVATTHAPDLLGQLSERSLEFASLTYRLPGQAAAGIFRVVDLPDARRVVRGHEVARLHTSGWFEDAVYFGQSSPVS